MCIKTSKMIQGVAPSAPQTSSLSSTSPPALFSLPSALPGTQQRLLG